MIMPGPDFESATNIRSSGDEGMYGLMGVDMFGCSSTEL